MQQVLNEKQTLKDEVRQRMELIAELEQAKVQLTDQCRRYEAEISAGKDRHDLLTQEKQVLEETVSRNKKQLNQNQINKHTSRTQNHDKKQSMNEQSKNNRNIHKKIEYNKKKSRSRRQSEGKNRGERRRTEKQKQCAREGREEGE